MEDHLKSRPIIFRQRAQELRNLSQTISEALRADLIKVALEWERLADQAEKEQAGTDFPRTE